MRRQYKLEEEREVKNKRKKKTNKKSNLCSVCVCDCLDGVNRQTSNNSTDDGGEVTDEATVFSLPRPLSTQHGSQ